MLPKIHPLAILVVMSLPVILSRANRFLTSETHRLFSHVPNVSFAFVLVVKDVTASAATPPLLVMVEGGFGVAAACLSCRRRVVIEGLMVIRGECHWFLGEWREWRDWGEGRVHPERTWSEFGGGIVGLVCVHEDRSCGEAWVRTVSRWRVGRPIWGDRNRSCGGFASQVLVCEIATKYRVWGHLPRELSTGSEKWRGLRTEGTKGPFERSWE